MIICPYCRKATLDSNTVCPYCGAALNKATVRSQQNTNASGARPSNYPIGGLVAWSVVTTLCCCLIPGIVALYYACNVNSSRTVSEQKRNIRACKGWCTFGMILAVIITIIATIIYLRRFDHI